MSDQALPNYAVWIEPLAVIGLGGVLVFGVAALASRWCRRAAWGRTVWQAALVGMVTLVCVEGSGSGVALVNWFRAMRAELKSNAFRSVLTPDEGVSSSTLGEDRERIAPRDAPETELSRDTQPRHVGAHRFVAPATKELSQDPSEGWLGSEAWLRSNTAGSQYAITGGALHSTPPIESRYSHLERVSQVSVPPRWPALVWLAGTVLVTIQMACAAVVSRVLGRRQRPLQDERICSIVDQLARRLGMRRRFRLMRSARLATPMAFGVLRPTIVLPRAFEHEFTSDEQSAILAHEVAHLAAGDPAWQLLANGICAGLWWHPAAWCMRWRLRSASESAADEASLLIPEGPELLATSLVALGRRMTMPRYTCGMSIRGAGFRSGLGLRVERLLMLRRGIWKAPHRGRLLLARTAFPSFLVIMVLFTTAWIRPQASFSQRQRGEPRMNLLKASWTRSLAAATVAALWSPTMLAASEEDEASAQKDQAVAQSSDQFASAFLAENDADDGKDEEEAEERGDDDNGDDDNGDDDNGDDDNGDDDNGDDDNGDDDNGDDDNGDDDNGDDDNGDDDNGDDDNGDDDNGDDDGDDEDGDEDDGDEDGDNDDGDDDGEEEEEEEEKEEEDGENDENEDEDEDDDNGGKNGKGESGEDKDNLIERGMRYLERQARERDKRLEALRKMATEVRAQLEHLADKRSDEAQKLNVKLEDIAVQMRELQRQRELAGSPRRQLEKMHRQIDQLRRAGKRGEADRVEQAMRRLARERDSAATGPDGDSQQRLDHLRNAIRHLHEAGMHEQAEELERAAEGLVRKHFESSRRGFLGPPTFIPNPTPPRGPGEPMERKVDDLRGEMQTIRAEMNELRKQLQELLEHQRRAQPESGLPSDPPVLFRGPQTR